MKAIIINAAPGAGKTTLLKLLEKKLSNSCAVIDGDDVGRTIPLEVSTNWLNLIQDNIVACAKNFRDYKIKALIISFVLPTNERVHRLMHLLREEGIIVYHITLTCDPEVLEDRIIRRNTTKVMQPRRAIRCNQQIMNLQSDYSIDTTHRSPEEISHNLSDLILKLLSGGEETNE